jgi:arginase
MSENSRNLRMVFPMWVGGNLPEYYLGAELLAWLAPETKSAVVKVPVDKPEGTPPPVEDGMTGRSALEKQLTAAERLLLEHAPQTVCVLGGDCLVDLVPFAYLSEKYGEELGILWLDTHPDIMTPAQHKNANAHVLGALMGNGDPMLTSRVKTPVLSSRVMIAGTHSPSDYEAQFLKENNIRTVSPTDMKKGTSALTEWIKKEKIKYLAVHFDVDILSHDKFMSTYFNNPSAEPESFSGIPQGQMQLQDVLEWIKAAGSQTEIVGFGVTEYLPWDAIRLKEVFKKLPLISQ